MYGVIVPLFNVPAAAKEVVEIGPLWNYLVTLDAPDLALALAIEVPEPCLARGPFETSALGALIEEFTFSVFI